MAIKLPKKAPKNDQEHIANLKAIEDAINRLDTLVKALDKRISALES